MLCSEAGDIAAHFQSGAILGVSQYGNYAVSRVLHCFYFHTWYYSNPIPLPLSVSYSITLSLTSLALSHCCFDNIYKGGGEGEPRRARAPETDFQRGEKPQSLDYCIYSCIHNGHHQGQEFSLSGLFIGWQTDLTCLHSICPGSFPSEPAHLVWLKCYESSLAAWLPLQPLAFPFTSSQQYLHPKWLPNLYRALLLTLVKSIALYRVQGVIQDADNI